MLVLGCASCDLSLGLCPNFLAFRGGHSPRDIPREAEPRRERYIFFITFAFHTFNMKKYYFAIVYLLWVVVVVALNHHQDLFSFSKPLFGGKLMLWAIFLGFSAYTIYCSTVEDFFKSLRKILVFRWGKQIGYDLLIGLSMFVLLIFLHSGSALAALLWIIPCVCFGNLAALLYFAMHYDSIVGAFI